MNCDLSNGYLCSGYRVRHSTIKEVTHEMASHRKNNGADPIIPYRHREAGASDSIHVGPAP